MVLFLRLVCDRNEIESLKFQSATRLLVMRFFWEDFLLLVDANSTAGDTSKSKFLHLHSYTVFHGNCIYS